MLIYPNEITTGLLRKIGGADFLNDGRFVPLGFH
jgi:hypothetical protein